MARINADTVELLNAAIAKLRADRPNAWREGVEPTVQDWITKHMPQLPRPHIHVRMLEDAATGRMRAKVTISVKPLFADVQISADTGSMA